MSNLPSFSESRIVPVQVLEQKCKNLTSPVKKRSKRTVVKKKVQENKKYKITSPDQILSSDLPADLKLKLHDQYQTRLNQAKHSKDFTENITSWKNVKEGILQLFPADDRDTVRDIFELYIEKNKKKIDWNPDTYEVILNERPLKDSHLIHILQYLLHPSDGSKPIGTEKVKTELLKLGVPSSWFGFVLPSTGINPIWSTPAWTPLTTRAASPPLFTSTPIAARVKKRTDRRPKVPYTPPSTGVKKKRTLELFDDDLPATWESLSGTTI